jgi:hypothetical protein
MIVGISYHPGDKSLMERWAAHVKKLGPYPNHTIILAPAHKAGTDNIKEVLESCFGKVDVQECFHTMTGWPVSCNQAFEFIARHVRAVYQQSFLWMEPDAIPVKREWLDMIDGEYKSCNKAFMGDLVAIKGIMPNGVDHMSGVGVYHWNLSVHAPAAFNNYEAAWDVCAGAEILRNFHHTFVIQHDWVPTKAWRRDKVTKEFVRPEAVIYHPDKLGVLMEDGLAVEGTRVAGEPQTGTARVGSSESPIEQPSTAPMTLVNALVRELKTHYENKKLRKTVIEELANAGFIKAKKRKYTRKKVQAPVVLRKRSGVGTGVSVSSDSQVEV